jgi:hypothetical protein
MQILRHPHGGAHPDAVADAGPLVLMAGAAEGVDAAPEGVASDEALRALRKEVAGVALLLLEEVFGWLARGLERCGPESDKARQNKRENRSPSRDRAKRRLVRC